MTKIFSYHNRLPAFFIGLFLLCQSATALSATGPSESGKSQTSPAVAAVEKILIDADHMQMNLESGKSIYTGHVKISQGALQLTGDVVTLEQKDNEVDRIIVTGKPARYNHVTEQGESITAESEHMIYTASQNKLVMTVNARLQQPDHKLSSPKIVYDTLKKTVMAGSTDSKPAEGTPASVPGSKETDKTQRVNITLTPKKQPQKTHHRKNRNTCLR